MTPTGSPGNRRPGTPPDSILEALEIEIDACEADYAALDTLYLVLHMNEAAIFKIRFHDIPCIRHGRPRNWMQPVNLGIEEATMMAVGIKPKFPGGGPRETVKACPYFWVSGRRFRGAESLIQAGQSGTTVVLGEDIDL